MRYLALIYTEDWDPSAVPPELLRETTEAYNRFTAAVQEAGVMLAGEALQPSSTATTVRVRDGKTTTTDGPFAETREVLGGYYVLDCKDLDEAIKWAAQIPAARTGSIEVRPIVEFGPEDLAQGMEPAAASRG